MATTDTTAEVLAFPSDPFPDDKALLERARVGDTAAFEELYRRHAQAAWRLAQAVTRNADDASDAVSDAFTKVFAALQRGSWSSDAPFRPYLLAATRNAAIDSMRRSGRFTSHDASDRMSPALTTVSDQAGRLEGAALVAAAFRALPERWRSVLWLTEVEGAPAGQAGELLGLSADGTAQLAVRARAGLRERYLQSHLQQAAEDGCKHTVERLGAHVAGDLSARDIAKVDQHLAGCEDCRARHAELEDVGSTLRRVMIPIPAALATAAAGRWKIGLASSTREAGVLDFEQILEAPMFRKVLGAAAAAIFTAGMIAAPFIGDNPQSGLPLAAPDVVEFENSSDDPVFVPDVSVPLAVDLGGGAAPVAGSFGGSGGDTSRVALVGGRSTATAVPADKQKVSPSDTGPVVHSEKPASPAPTAPKAPAAAPSTPTTLPLPSLPLPTGNGGGGGGGGNGGGATTTTAPAAEVGVGGGSGGNSGAVSVTVGDAVEVGADLGGVVVGNPPSNEPPAEDGVQIDAGGALIPEQSIKIP